MQKYYLMAISLGHIDAMINYGLYFYKIKDYVNMKKYYLMAIEKGKSKPMDNCIIYYITLEKTYIDAIYLLSNYYSTIEYNINERNKYICMAYDALYQ